MSTQQKRWLAVLLIIGCVLALDIITKRIITGSLFYGETREPIAFLAPHFQITLSYNSGAAFGILPQAGSVFLIFAIIAVIVLLRYFNRIAENAPLTRLASGLIVGGALGNAADRIQHGHVIDFIHYSVPQLGLSNVSNLADHAIVAGVLLVLFDSWRLERLEKRQKAAASQIDLDSPNVSGETDDPEIIV
jgi:signal peptidase II